MGQVKLQKRQKAWLVEAVNACLAHIDLLEDNTNDSKVRSELRELKKAVFVDPANAHRSVPADTQDYLDRSDTGWDAILKLAAEQNSPPVTSNMTPNADATPPPVATSIGENDTGRTTPRPSWPSGSSWQGPRPCGACHPSPP
jgi:hypothetical protein